MLLSLYESVFASLGFEVLAASSPNEALQHLSSHGADIAILDYDMPEMDGGALASLIKDRCPMLPVILYSGNTSIPNVARRWVDAVCAKAAPRGELLATIERLSQNTNHEQENNRLRTFAPSSNH
jgi:two-component system capsular synthesis sensor histidine kinase RcsC